MPALNVVCVTRTLELISIEEQNLTEVYGGGGSGQVIGGHGKVVLHGVQSQNRQKQTVWFKDSSGRDTSRTLYNVDLNGRPGHEFVEYELQSPGCEDKPLRYVNVSTGTSYQVYDLLDLGVEWGLLRRPWESGSGLMLIGGVVGFFLNIPLAWLLMQLSDGLGVFSYLFVGPIAGAIGLPTLIERQVNSTRSWQFERFEKAVNESISKTVSA
jgi:hypothetical protein